MKKMVLVDGNSIAYRAFFALPLLNNDKGVYTNAVYGFTTMLLKILEEENPTHMLVAFDAGKTTFRHKTYEKYKGTRQKTPPELSEQLPVMRDLLKAFQIEYYDLKNYEADDIIGTYAKLIEKEEDWQTVIYSGDKDLLQLVTKKTTVIIPKKGITNVDKYDLTLVDERYGLIPDQIIDMKGLMGDSSDNIPGVPGIGEKTAIKLLKEYQTLEGVYENIESISAKKMKEKLVEFKAQALMSKELATIFLEAPIEKKPSELLMKDRDETAIVSLFKELGFSSLLSRISSGGVPETEEKLENIEVEIVTEIKDQLNCEVSSCVIESLEENYHHAEIAGISIANENGVFFISTEIARESEEFKNWAADNSKKKYIFDGKRAIASLGWEDILLDGVSFDVQIASYLIDPSASSHEMADIAERYQGIKIKNDELVYGKGKKKHVPAKEEFAQHLGRKAASILTLKNELTLQLKKNNQWELFTELEMPLSVVLGKMEKTGIAVDRNELTQMGDMLKEKLAEIEKEIHELAGEPFNINSPKQMATILFEKLELPAIKKTKTGYSTSADVLEKLKDTHAIIPPILLYRQLGKLNSTYIEGLLKAIHHKTEKIHTIFNQSLTQTGRLSSTEPNLQNIPIRLEEGRKIRKAFVPVQKENVLLAADYSQIELRVLAHISKDESLIQAFTEGMDVHTKTAMDVFGVSKEEVTSQMRRTAKAVNFGIVYGISDYGLSESLGITRKKAKIFIEKYLESYPGVKNYMENIVEEAREKGYVTTMLQRRRFLPEITSRNFNLRSFAERTAMNTPIQGSAADIIKKAMVEMAAALEIQNLKSTLLLQVHDELIFEVPPEELEMMKKLVPSIMEKAVELSVPLVADVSYGGTWYDAK